MSVDPLVNEYSDMNAMNILINNGMNGISLQKAGIEFGMEQTARLLTRLDPRKEGFINYT